MRSIDTAIYYVLYNRPNFLPWHKNEDVVLGMPVKVDGDGTRRVGSGIDITLRNSDEVVARSAGAGREYARYRTTG